MTTFLLIRHGQTAWIGHALAGHTPGVGLDEVGKAQAEQLADRLQTVPIAAIYSSPLQRTIETAKPLARARRLTIEASPRLIEVDFGEWTGLTMSELDADPRWKKFNTVRSLTRAPGGDLMLDVQSRMVDELQALHLRYPEQTVAIVSHQDAIKAAIAHYAGIPLDLFHRFEIHPASISVLRLSDHGPQIVCVNDRGGPLTAA